MVPAGRYNWHEYQVQSRCTQLCWRGEHILNTELKVQINIAIHYTQLPGDHTSLQLTEEIQSWTSALNTWRTSNFRKNWQNELNSNSCSKCLSNSFYSIVLDSVCVHSILDSSHYTISKLIIIKNWVMSGSTLTK